MERSQNLLCYGKFIEKLLGFEKMVSDWSLPLIGNIASTWLKFCGGSDDVIDHLLVDQNIQNMINENLPGNTFVNPFFSH